jgi:hypothetical protein
MGDKVTRDHVNQEWGPEAARWYALAWIDQNLPAPSSPLSASQLHELMYELAILAVDENLRTHGDETQLAASPIPRTRYSLIFRSARTTMVM